jgi:hypothetical protein
VYDANKWAVVFKYTSVNVLAGKKLTFKNHATRAPVVWLVSGNVTISGAVDLSGESPFLVYTPANPASSGLLAEPGPGGFRGGASWRGGDVLAASGFGPGGGLTFDDTIGTVLGLPGAYAAAGVTGNAPTYGNPSLVPLVGGSGGGGNYRYLGGNTGRNGGGGGGALMVASSGRISIAQGGSVLAMGGNGFEGSGSGSGGGVRLVCQELAGLGSINASGGTGAGAGRIRVERVVSLGSLTVQPAPSAVDLVDGSAALIWPSAGAPEAKIVSISDAPVPTDPAAAFGASTPDVALALNPTANVIVETLNVERASRVVVRVTPRNGMTVNRVAVRNATEVNATIKEVVSESPLKLRWQAVVPTLPGHSAIQARIVRP